MKQHPSTNSARRRAMGAATALILASGAVFLAPAAAEAKAAPKKGSVSATLPLTCTLFGTTEFDYPAAIKLSGTRAPKSKTVALKATMSDMPGVSPVPLDYDDKSALTLSMGGVKAVLKGKGHANVPASTPVPMPPVKGSLKNIKNSFAVTVTKFTMTMIDPKTGTEVTTITCVPTDSKALGTLKLK